MIPVFSFSWQSFEPVQVTDAKVGELYEVAKQHSDPFMFHDFHHRYSALLIPELVTQTVEKLNIPHDELAARTGLFDVLRRDQISVHHMQPASRVAGLAAYYQAHVVVVVDDNQVPAGLFVPSVLLERLPNSSLLSTRFPQLKEHVTRFVKTGNLFDAIRQIEEELDEFHSEGINAAAAALFICDGYGNPHYRNTCNGDCPEKSHKGAGCRLRSASHR